MVTVTRALIHKGMSSAGGWSNAQLRLLGLRIPLSAGWIDRLEGTEISEGAAEQFLRLRDAHKVKKAPKAKKKKRQRVGAHTTPDRPKKEVRRQNYREVESEYAEAEALAAEHHIELRRCSPFHLQLRVDLPDERWKFNIWPGSKKTWMDYDSVNAPNVTPPANWTLLELVSAVIAASS
jgi:hypothetical protein